MISLSKQERAVLYCFVCVLVIGSSLHYALKQKPELRTIMYFIDSDKSYPKININTATARQLEEIPYIGGYTAKNIVLYRNEVGHIKSLEELKRVKGVKRKNFIIFSKYLRVGVSEGKL